MLRRVTLSLLLILCGFVAGLVVTGRMWTTTDSRADTAPAAPERLTAPAAAVPSMAALAIALRVSPVDPGPEPRDLTP